VAAATSTQARARWFGRVDAADGIAILIVAFAACLRLGWPAVTEFKADEARLLGLALDMADFKSFALRGIGSSVGFPNFPMSVWLYSLPLLIWRHPYSATLFVGLLNTAAVGVTYRLVRRYWGTAAALTAALMFAASPWAVIYSRKIWAQDLLPLFILAYAGTALAAFVDGRRWALFFHIACLAVVVQIHLSGAALAVVTCVWAAAFWRRSLAAWRELLLGVGAAVVLALPFVFWAAQHADTSASALFPGAVLTGPAKYDLESLRLAWLVWCGFDTHSLAGPGAFRSFLDSVPNLDPIRWVWGMLTIGGLIVVAWRRRPVDLMLASWLVLPVAFFVRHSTPVYPHYFIITLPAAYVLAGIATEALLRWAGGRTWHVSIAVLLVAVCAIQAAAWVGLLAFIASHDTAGGFGTPLGTLLSAAEAARAQAARSGVEVLLVGEGDDPAVSEFPAVMGELLRDQPHRYVDGRATALLPQAGAVVILQTLQLRAAARFYLVCESCRLIHLEDRGPAVVTLKPGAANNLKVQHQFAAPRSLANGVEMLGWETSPGWAVVWRTGYVPAASDYHFFNHGSDAQADGVGFPSKSWHDGDTVISYFDLAAHGPVRVGMYEYPAVRNVPVMDSAGNPYSDAVSANP
jgi:hypothetical protein